MPPDIQTNWLAGWLAFLRLVGGSSPNPPGHYSWQWALHHIVCGYRPSSTAYAEPRPIKQVAYSHWAFNPLGLPVLKETDNDYYGGSVSLQRAINPPPI